MDKRFTWIFLLVSAAFFVFIVGLTGYRIEDARKRNALAAREAAASLAARAQSLRDLAGGWDAPQFATGMRQVFDAQPRLLLLSLHSADDGFLYYVARERSYLRVPSSITPDWRGEPSYQLARGSDALLTRLLESDGSQVTMDAGFVIMGSEDLYPVVRDDLFLFLAFLLVCGVLLLIVMSIQQDAQREGNVDARIRVVPPDAPRGAALSAGPAPRSTVTAPTAARGAAGRAAGAAAGSVPPGAASLLSPRTGLVWAQYLDPKLSAEIDRAASSDTDICFARVCIDGPRNDARLPMAHADIAAMLKAAFSLHDLLFEAGDDSFSLILPDTDIDAAVRSLDAFRTRVASAPVQGRTRTVSVGVTSRGGRLIEAEVLRDEAEIAVVKASREGGNQVIGFRADAARFRGSLSAART